MMAHVMGERNVRLFLRLNPDVNERLRAATRYQGDLSEYIAEALVSVDLSRVALLHLSVGVRSPYWPTQSSECGWTSGLVAFVVMWIGGFPSSFGSSVAYR